MPEDAHIYNRIIHGDALEGLKTLPDNFVQCCVTSPPYWSLRDYGVEGQIGLEQSPGEYVERLVAVFREVWRVLKDDGVLWLNLGDTYAAGGAKQTGRNDEGEEDLQRRAAMYATGQPKATNNPQQRTQVKVQSTLTPKNLVGIPWHVAFALQSDGWILRSDVIWHKTNTMPESVKDRPTKSHEYVFLLAKSERYFYDCDAIKEDIVDVKRALAKTNRTANNSQGNGEKGSGVRFGTDLLGRNRRTVWDIATIPYKDAHFAVMSPRLAEICILAGSRIGDVVLDPFSGAGTTAYIASKLGRKYVGIELNVEYIALSQRRLSQMALEYDTNAN